VIRGIATRIELIFFLYCSKIKIYFN